MLLRTSLSALAACLASSPAAFADVFTVGGTNPTHATLQAAVDDALPGDVVLVRSFVAESVIVSQGIAIVADAPEPVGIWGEFRVANVNPGQTFLLSGFVIAGPAPMVVHGNLGAVRIQDCRISANPNLPGTQDLKSLGCSENADVALLGCTVQGPAPPGYPWDPSGGALGMRLTNSVVSLQDTDVRGGPGASGSYPFGQPPGTAGQGGGPAIVVDGGALVLQCSTVSGGNGGAGLNGSCEPGYPPTAGGFGGVGLVLRNGATVRAVGGRTLGGVGGAGGLNPCDSRPDGAHGIAVQNESGSWERIEGPRRTLESPRIVRVGSPLALAVHGNPFEQAILARASSPAHVDIPESGGVLLIGGAVRRVNIGFLDAQGTSTLGATTPPLPSGVTNDLLHLQPACVDATGAIHLGCARVVVRIAAGT